MKLIERIIILAILALVAAFIVNGLRPYHPKPEGWIDDLEVAAVSVRIIPACELGDEPIQRVREEPEGVCEESEPYEMRFKTPADDMKDPMTELKFSATDELSMKRSLADFERSLPADKYAQILELFKSKHEIKSEQDDNGVITLRFPSLIALKVYDGKTPQEILK
jgi:hypothetical protein